MSKHTPGPFEFKCGIGSDPRDFIVIEPTGNTVAETNTALYNDASEFDPAVHQITIEEAIANSHLFAAAPELLWTLSRIIEDLPSSRNWLDPNIERSAKDAIAKAEGHA